MRKDTRDDEGKRDDGGMRRMLQDDLREERAQSPRYFNRAGEDGYLDGLTRRPLFGIHKLARISEHYLYQTRFGKMSKRRFEASADYLFFEIRQEIRNLLAHWKPGTPLGPVTRRHLREKIPGLAEACRSLERMLGTVRRFACPCCRGTGRILDTDGTFGAVEAVLKEAVKAGRLGYSKDYGYYGI